MNDIVEDSRERFHQNKKELKALNGIHNKVKDLFSKEHREHTRAQKNKLTFENEILHETGNKRVPHQILDNYNGDLSRRLEEVYARRDILSAQATALNNASVATMDAFQQGALGYQDYGSQIHSHQIEADRIYLERERVDQQERQDYHQSELHLHEALQMNKELDKKRILPREIKEMVFSYF